MNATINQTPLASIGSAVETRKSPAAPFSSSISLAQIRFSTFSRLIAALLIWLMGAPLTSFVTHSNAFSAQAAVGAPCTTEALIPAGCTNPDLAQLEADSVQSYLAMHGLPASEASIIYTLGRADLRGEVRTLMFVKLMDIIEKKVRGAGLTNHESNLYQWFQALVWKNEIAMYQAAVADRDAWVANPCSWRPDADVASGFNLMYRPPARCNDNTMAGLFSIAPSIPTRDYYIAAALKKTYLKPISDDPTGVDTLKETVIHAAAIWGASVSGVQMAAAGTAFLMATLLTHASTAAGTSGAVATSLGLGEAVASSASGAVVGISIASMVLCFVALVVSTIEVIADQTTLKALQDLDKIRNYVVSTPSDLSAMLRDTTGYIRLSAAFVKATLPDHPSTAPLPARDANDARFVIVDASNNSTSSADSINYLDWDGSTFVTSPYHGWLVSYSNTRSGISPTIRIQDWNGRKYYASRTQNGSFLISKLDQSASDQNCPADPITNLSNPADPSLCRAYLSNSVKLLAPGGRKLTISLASKPSFTSLNTTSFSQKSGVQNFEITAAGAPAPVITYVKELSVLSFNSIGSGSSQTGPGRGRLQYYGGSSAPQGTYTTVVQATNAYGTATQTITVYVGNPPAFTNVPVADFYKGWNGSFTVKTSGYPAPAIGVVQTGLALPAGITFRDQGNGTAVLSGTPTGCQTQDSNLYDFSGGFTSSMFTGTDNGNIATLTPNYILTATNTLGKATANTMIATICSTPAQILGPADVVLTADQNNSFVWNSASTLRKHTYENDHWNYTSVSDKVQMTCEMPVSLSMLSCTDPGNGTIVLSGRPPANFAGVRSSIRIKAHAVASLQDNPPVTVNVTIAPAPLFGRLDDIFFQPGANNFSQTFISSAPSTTFSVSGTLPDSVTYSGVGAMTVSYNSYSGVDAAGGFFPVTVTANGPYGKQTFQQNIYIKTPPAFATGNTATFVAGAAGSFNVITSGFPKAPVYSPQAPAAAQGMSLTVSGMLPQGVTFNSTNASGQNTGNGVFSGTPCASCTGDYPVTVTAKNMAGTQTQQMILRVLPAGSAVPVQ